MDNTMWRHAMPASHAALLYYGREPIPAAMTYRLQKNASLTIVVPFCDEETDVITENLGIIHRYAQMLGSDYEIVVVRDGGENLDFLHHTFKTPAIRYRSNSVHRGKGFVVRQGVRSSRGEIVCFLDGDLAISPDHLVPYIQAIRGGPTRRSLHAR